MSSVSSAGSVSGSVQMGQEVEMAGGKVSSSKVDMLHLIPTDALTGLADRFAVGSARKGDKAWNATTKNHEALDDREFLLERVSHVIRHELLVCFNGELKMPCDCSGFETEHSAFGKKFKGVSGGYHAPEEVPYEEMITEGERCLCKCQDVLFDLLMHIDDVDFIDDIPEELQNRVYEQLRMLVAHKESEGMDASEIRAVLANDLN